MLWRNSFMRLAVVVLMTLSACRPRHAMERLPTPPPASTAPHQTGEPVRVERAAVGSPARELESPLAPPEQGENAAAKARRFLRETNGRLRDAYFDYDRASLRLDAQQALQFDYQLLRGLLADFPQLLVMVEGHCDERGSAEYNLALGDRRANLAIQYLVELGLPANKLRAVSYGKEKPQCIDDVEACWQRNRRAHLTAVEPAGAPD